MTEDWNCFTVDLIILNVALACVDGFIAFITFAQVLIFISFTYPF